MNLSEAIAVRRSRRKYLGTPIAPDEISKLRETIDQCNKVDGIRMELVTNNGKAFNGFTRSYGMFSGVNDYICLIAKKDDPTAEEKLGYYGELAVLSATALGLGTCWVGGTFRKSDMPIKLTNNETLSCAVIVGNVGDKDSAKERLIHRLTHRKCKSAKEMFECDAPVPKWFMQGMTAVERAPSALNRQPVLFAYKGGTITASVKDIHAPGMALDFGIAKLHFKLGAGDGEWEWGNGGVFVR